MSMYLKQHQPKQSNRDNQFDHPNQLVIIIFANFVFEMRLLILDRYRLLTKREPDRFSFNGITN